MLIAACIVGDLSLTTSEVQVEGSSFQRTGFAIDIAGDLNGDGADDFVVTSPRPGVDSVHVFFGPIPPSTLSTATPDVAFEGESGGEAGWSIAVGDLTGDGQDDLVIGAPSERAEAGNVYVVAGPLSGGTLGPADATALIGGVGGYLGWDLDVGDFNGDDKPDLAVGACQEENDGVETGAVYVIDGPLEPGDIEVTSRARAKYVGPEAESQLGCTVVAAGDVGVKGHDSLLLGAAQVNNPEPAAGAVYLLYEPASVIGASIEDVADATFRGAYKIHNAGFAVGGRGDFNGDGADDVVIGAPSEFCARTARYPVGTTYCSFQEPVSSVHVFYGGYEWLDPGPVSPNNPWKIARLGGEYSVLDGDVNVFANAPSTKIVATPIVRSSFGMSIAWTNSTGNPDFDDIIVGAPLLNRAYLIHGTDSLSPPTNASIEDIPTVLYLGEEADEHAVAGAFNPATYGLYGDDAAGLAVAGGGDIDGDGIEDVAVSAPGQLWFADSGGTPGRAFVMYGSEAD